MSIEKPDQSEQNQSIQTRQVNRVMGKKYSLFNANYNLNSRSNYNYIAKAF